MWLIRKSRNSAGYPSLHDRTSSVSLLSSHGDSDEVEKGFVYEGAEGPEHYLPYRKILQHVHNFLLYSLAIIGLGAIMVNLEQLFRPKDLYLPMYDANYTVHYKEQPCHCGASVGEAQSLGCTYDELSTSWLPPHCRDDDLTAEFTATGDNPDGGWMYWADKNHTQSLTLEQVSQYAEKQPENFHMSYEWHRQHCFFLWLKEHRMKARGMVYDPRSDSEHHILHCIAMLSHVSNGTAAGATFLG